MEYTFKLLPVVHNDLEKAKKWYSNQRSELGEAFQVAVNKDFDYIRKSLNISSASIRNCDSQ